MKTRIVIGGALASAAVLVGAWEAGQTATSTSSQASSTDTSSTNSSSSTDSSSGTGTSTGSDTPTATPTSGSSSGSSASSGSSSSTTTSTYKNGTFTGSTISTRYGDVQVSVTITSGKITAVTALHLTDDDGRSVQISAQAAPLLEQEVLSAQSAAVDTIGGATYTSDGYLQSLQAALDQAK